MEMELTDREAALARGENPDEPEVVEDPPVSESAEIAETVVPEGDKEVDVESDSGKEAAPWYSDSDKQLASSYGLDEEQLKQFESADDFQRYAKIFDKQLVAKPAAEVPAAKVEPQPGTNPPKISKIDIERFKAEGYSDDTIETLTRHNELVDYVERLSAERDSDKQFLSQIQQAITVAEQQRQADAFHDAVDSLGDSRFGRAFKDGYVQSLSKTEDDARRALFEAAETIAAGIQARAEKLGQKAEIPPLPVLLKRAQQMAFAEDIRADERRKVQEAVTKQSMKRRPVAASRGDGGRFAKRAEPTNINEAAKEVANLPDVVALWNKLQEANGSA